MSKRTVSILVIFILVIIAVLLGASWYFSSVLLYPPRSECPKEHFIYCKGPEEVGLKYDNVSFKTSDYITISGWYVPAGNSQKAVLTVHGRGATRHEGMRWLKSLHDAGFNVLLIDLRHQGKSEGSINSMGYHEKKDVLAAVDFLTKEKNISSIGILSVSMGVAASVPAMVEDKRIKAGIFEAGFTDFQQIITERAKVDFGLPKYPMMPLVMMFYEMRGNLDVDVMKPVEQIGEISPRPVFIIHCKDDDYIDYTHGKNLFKAAKEPKEFWEAPCDKHAEAWQGDPAKAEKLVTTFFRKNL
ncbi:MAG: alpha/beta hydrolase [Spirochaetota bacterium]